MNTKKLWLAARNAVFKVSAFWILLFAAYLAIGRQFFPYIERFKPEIEVWLSSQLGAQVEVGRVSGEWERFNPVVYLSDVQVGDALSIGQLTLAPGFYESIARGGLSFIRFDLIDFQAELFQTDNGWQMRGLAQNMSNQNSFAFNSILELLRRQQQVQFINAQLLVAPQELPPFDVTLHTGQLREYSGENGLSAVASLFAKGIEIPIEIQVETSQVDPSKNRAFLKHGSIDLTPWFVDVPLSSSEAIVSGQYWINFDSQSWLDVTARLNAPSLNLDGPYNDLPISDLTLEAFIENQQDGTLEAWLNILEYRLFDEEFGPTQLKVSLEDSLVTGQWDVLPAAWVGHWFNMSDPNDFWLGIAPNGFAKNGRLTWSPDQPGSLALSAEFSDLSVQSFKAVPGVKNISGEVKIDGSAGRLIFSSDETPLRLSELYDSPFRARLKNGVMDWQVGSGLGVLSQGHVDIDVLDDDESRSSIPVSVFWATSSPSTQEKQEGREGRIEVQVTADNVSLPWAKEFANTNLVSMDVRQFIDQQILVGEFSDAELNYLSSKNITEQPFSQFFLNASVSQGEATFLESWAAVSDISGELEITDSDLTLVSDAASYTNFDIKNGVVELDYQSGELRTRLNGSGTIENALSFLKDGPLRPLYGDRIDQWYATDGQAAIELELTVPLSDPNEFDLFLTADVTAERVELQDFDLAFTEAQGQLNFDHERGLYATDLFANHLGFPQTISLDAQFGNEPIANIDITGMTSVSYWGERFNDIFLSRQVADISHSTNIIVQRNTTRISSESNLVGWQIDLPEPYFKASEAPIDLNLTVTRDVRDWLTIRSNIGESIQSYAEFDDTFDLQRASVAVNQPLNVRANNGVYIDVQASSVDGTKWWQLIQSLRADEQVQIENPQAESFIEKIAEINIQANQLEYLSRLWKRNTTNILRNEEGWLVGFDSLEGRGQIFIPHNEEAMFADIQFLSLVSEGEDLPFEEQIDPLLAYSPMDVPDMRLQINKLIWNGRDLGSWRAELEQADNRLIAKNLLGNMAGALLNGELVWQIQNGQHKTAFDGNIAVGNIIDVLKTWQYAPVLTSADGAVEVAVQWQGSPSFFDFKRLQGVIDLRLNRGAILDVEEYEGVKLVGLLNFTRVLQRIAFDFSDLLQEGITFDTIEGDLLFDRGFARVGEKLEIDGSATNFRFNGDADLLSDELDIDMVLVVPLSSTFPLVALLAGVSPQAAAAIFVTERVFNNQLERLSSARMHVTGSFEEPDVRFYRAVEGVGSQTQSGN